MSTAKILLEDFDIEMAGARKTLERIPADKPAYAPHTKSMPMGRLAMHLATMPLFGKYILTDPGMDLAAPIHPHESLEFTTSENLLATFDKGVAACRAALAAATDESLAQPWKFSFGEHPISNDSRSLSYRRMFFNHFIHHRAQLGVYLRLNDVAVPGLYGPSADEPFTP